MRDGFVRVCVATPEVSLANCDSNASRMVELIQSAVEKQIKLLVFPELGMTGCTAGDLFYQQSFRQAAIQGLRKVVSATQGNDVVVVVGMPLEMRGTLYNCAVVVQSGKILGVVPKQNFSSINGTDQRRWFVSGKGKSVEPVELLEQPTFFGENILFCCRNMPEFCLGVEVGEDSCAPVSPSARQAMAGATVIANPSAFRQWAGGNEARRNVLTALSKRLGCGFLQANAGVGESTSDYVFSGKSYIEEDGQILAESSDYETGLTYTELDAQALQHARSREAGLDVYAEDHYTRVYFDVDECALELSRQFSKNPFIPNRVEKQDVHWTEMLSIQGRALAQRMKGTNLKCAVIGLSGGLDSTLAILAIDKAFSMNGWAHSGILAVTMPCFGTTKRTKQNAKQLAAEIGATLIEVDITEAVTIHLRDIGHDLSTHDVTFENVQARERTQVLMDLANMHNGLVVGTGNMSEAALGWSTYNGDHMSMYSVNASIPKTVVREMVAHAAKRTENSNLRRVLEDILNTPISPELLPAKEEKIVQQTEGIVGPYALHDFFLYHFLQNGYRPRKIVRIANIVFREQFSPVQISRWAGVFFKRFFAQQFKRNCVPDGPAVGLLSLSPRGGLVMPSDARADFWIEDIN